MAGAYLISPEYRTVTYHPISAATAISEIVLPDYGVTTVRINKFGDCLHFDAEASDQPETASFHFIGYLAPISGAALITGALIRGVLKNPVYDLDQIAELVLFDPPPSVGLALVSSI